jgi:hypothetical protein
LSFELVDVRRRWLDGGADDVCFPGLVFERQCDALCLMFAPRQVGCQVLAQSRHARNQWPGIAQRRFAKRAAFQHQGRGVGVDPTWIASSGQIVE